MQPLTIGQLAKQAGVNLEKGRAEAKIADIEEKIKALQRMRTALLQLTQACRGSAPAKECPILDAMVRKRNGHA